MNDGDGFPVDRRTLLKGVGAASLLTAGCLEQQDVRPATRFGYGGVPVVDQTALSTAGETESEPNDERATATQIPVGVTVAATLATDEVDWFAFDATADQQYTVTCDRAGNAGVAALVLYDHDGQFHDQVYVGNGSPTTLTERVQVDGLHYAQVVDVANGAGDYTLQVTESGTPAPIATPTPSPTPTETPTPSPTPTETPTPSPSPTPTPTSGTTDAYGVQGYGEYGYGG